MNIDNLTAKFFCYFLPLNLLFLMILTQASHHFLSYQKDKNEYIPRGNLLELSRLELKKFYIYLDPTGKYFFENKFIDLLLLGDYAEFILQDYKKPDDLLKEYKEFSAFSKDIRFVKQETVIQTGNKQFSALMPNSERLLKSSIMIGVNKDDTPKLCYKPYIFQMLFKLENISTFDLHSIASRFACDCNNYPIDSFDKNKLDKNQTIDYYNVYRAFIRESLSILKPIKVSAKLSFSNFVNYVFVTNFKMNSSELEVRTKQIDGLKILFPIVTYFLLALQAAALCEFYKRIFIR